MSNDVSPSLMKIHHHPSRTAWGQLLTRPVFQRDELETTVREIMRQVREHGDDALRDYSRRFDRTEVDVLELTPAEIAAATDRVPQDVRDAIATARANLLAFHEPQRRDSAVVETMPGIRCWRRMLPIERVGLYIPGGTAPLISTVLMLGVPALVAGCSEVVLCSPPTFGGDVHPAIVYAAAQLGIRRIFRTGGAQSIAAMTYGTASIPAVHKIFGPGNQYVTQAKELAQRAGVAIDMPAGPSEVLVVSDAGGRADFIAADLLSQAEHGVDSQSMFVTTDAVLAEAVQRELDHQLTDLPRADFARQSLANGSIVVLPDLETAMAFSNAYAPEHLILAGDDYQKMAALVRTAGSVFLGNYSCESAGDYASGTNHTLPTNGYARNYSGVSVDSFMNKVTFQELNATGLQHLAPTVTTLARAEQLEAHARAVEVRLRS